MDPIYRLTELLSEVVNLLVKSGFGIDPRIGSKFGEVWVANQMKCYKPQIGWARNKRVLTSTSKTWTKKSK